MFLRKCSKKWTSHINPDGRTGGNVPLTAKVGKNVTIARSAIISADASIPDNTIVSAGEIFTKDGPLRFSPNEFL